MLYCAGNYANPIDEIVRTFWLTGIYTAALNFPHFALLSLP